MTKTLLPFAARFFACVADYVIFATSFPDIALYHYSRKPEMEERP